MAKTFFYRDAQYHRIGLNLHQVPVSCPVMSQSHSLLGFDGQMRVDANHAGTLQYVPNSYAAESAYQVADGICSRNSHHWHEGKKSEYAQARELWSRVMSDEQRTNPCYNTGKSLNLCNQTLIRKKYLA